LILAIGGKDSEERSAVSFQRSGKLHNPILLGATS
jgi:hypothetical protein